MTHLEPALMDRIRSKTQIPGGVQRFAAIHDQNGSGLVETALSLSMLLTMIFGVVECSRAVYIDHFLANAAREAARYSMVRGSSWGTSCASVTSYSCTATSSNVTAFVQSIESAGVQSAHLTVNTTWPGLTADNTTCTSVGNTSTNAVGCLVLVKLTYSFTYASPLLPKGTLTLTSSSEETISQ